MTIDSAGDDVAHRPDPALRGHPIVSEPAPILTVWTPEDVVRQTLVALDPAWRLEYRRRAERWIREHHSGKRVVEGHLEMYETLLDLRQASVEVE